MQQKYDSYAESSSGGSDFDSDTELITTINCAFEGTLNRAFATASDYGASFGINYEDAELVDGGLYIDPEKGKYKIFSWNEITGFSPVEALENGDTPTADDVREVLPKTYGDTQKNYEAVGARVPEITDEDGEVLVEATSTVRDYRYNDDGELEWQEFEDAGGDTIHIGNVVMWYSGTQENGPTVAALRLAELLSEHGDDQTDDEDDIFNWLNYTDGSNVLREELDGRRVRFFTVRRTSEESGRGYNLPILEDAKTGERVYFDNSTEGDSGN